MSDEILEPTAESNGLQMAKEFVEAEAGVANGQSSPVQSTTDEVSAVETSKEDFMQLDPDQYASTFRTLKEGDIVKGIVVRIDRDSILVDVGSKSEGVVRRHELHRDMNLAPEEIVSIGQEIDVQVLEPENSRGNMMLSKRRADFKQGYEALEKALANGEVISAYVISKTKGGLNVDVGVKGFVPGSQVGSGFGYANLDSYVGQTIPVRVIDLDKSQYKIILSNRVVVEEDRKTRKEESFDSLEVGQIKKGTVRRLTDYGAFVDIGGMDGLLHVSEISWARLKSPADELTEGQEIEVAIQKIELDKKRVSLSRKATIPDPWTTVSDSIVVGDTVEVTITKHMSFGCFVALKSGIEGIIPNVEVSIEKSKTVDLPPVGTKHKVRVIDLRPGERKITFSLKQILLEEEAKNVPPVEETSVEVEHDATPEPQEETVVNSESVKEPVVTDDKPKIAVPETPAKTITDAPRFTIADALRAKGYDTASRD